MKDISECAGKVAQVLERLGKTALKKVTRETGLSWSDVHRSVGWLAHGEKIDIFEDGKRHLIQLKEAGKR